MSNHIIFAKLKGIEVVVEIAFSQIEKDFKFDYCSVGEGSSKLGYGNGNGTGNVVSFLEYFLPSGDGFGDLDLLNNKTHSAYSYFDICFNNDRE
jgi:hypothetical protein